MILKLGMKHLAMELYKIYINHDPGLTFYMARSTWHEASGNGALQNLCKS